ncbi:MAG: NAD(P)/FAD-dependent oxidoreductase [Alphaproteobacteria bacterium]|nr:NAD(P)/FAD-dependent oxidoreductase [Alphaproteobacteria bacterium]MBU1516109.1 NAD(P)/FAD-dependent oxidoreductase [Alphaproteobacteria bacterium]MBU2092676.1 NAD(P)/FAD-dependent oxidoreductase [Alphaproteobacteria bacterium]MBU2153799.1 NAD(P)/FAD-dependent oxidoreductase [Alphaproteobacteria bacterium]MBU2308427.1 NAD(P)/FAD-dependent oxidoreductase [Alphaproteobacteria bacterium]
MSDVFDPAALKAKYLTERDKRLHARGKEQYQVTDGAFGHYLDDPYVPPIVREAILRDIDVLVIGGGFGGLLAAGRLREAGVDDILVVEKGGDFGGTWYWNRYPGAQCDIESYVYMPLLEELGYVPTLKYAFGPEILEHSRAIGRKFDLYPRTLFQTEVTDLSWDGATSRWIATTNRGDKLRARFVAMSTGPLHRPKLPGIPGIETFEGHSFHTSRWDYEYTGGDHQGGLTGLADKRVGIIGTGATAIQAVPHLGQAAKHLYVFQRTPSSVDERRNRPTDEGWKRGLDAGWQQARMDNFNQLVSGGQADVDLVDDGWTKALRRNTQGSPAEMEAARQLADFRKMEEIRARVDREVHDPATAAALKPWYNQMCKRPTFNDDYLPTFNRPNVTLVDTEGRGVDRVTPTGVLVGDVEYEIDCLIYATGFEFQTSFARRAGYEIHGRGGLPLSDKYKDGALTLYGVHTRDFPNCFILGNAQQANTPNFTHMLNEVSRHIAYVVRNALDRQVKTVEPTVAAEQAWLADVMSFANMRRAFDEECTPGYYNNEGMPNDLAVRNNFYGGGSLAFIKLLNDWRAAGDMAGLELKA